MRPSTMMPNTIFILLSMSVIAIEAAISPRSLQQSDDPTTYFGGLTATDHMEYLDWFETKGHNFPNSIFLPSDTDDGMAVHWSVDEDSVKIAFAAQATGWIGFGIAETGGMRGADVVTFESATMQLVDRHVLGDNIKPIPDDCQNWDLIESFVGNEFMIITVQRLLDTGDAQDRAIIKDGDKMIAPTRVIGAWSDNEDITYHGSNRVRGAVRFFGSGASDEYLQFLEDMRIEADGSFLLSASNYSIPSTNHTTYADFCLPSSYYVDVLGVPLDQELHIIGFEPVIDPRGAKYVHHLNVGEQRFTFYGNDCSSFFSMGAVYMWAAGEGPLSLPPEVGVALGKNEGIMSMRLEIHYDNRLYEEGLLDSSGIRFYYTSTRRQHNLAIFATGDTGFSLAQQSIGPGRLNRHAFDCPASCTATGIKDGPPLQVIREFLHMHEGGASMYTEQIRNGTVLRKASVEYFDYAQQGIFAVVQEPYTIERGDEFRTVCEYDSDRPLKFGYGSEEEMCVAFMWYYPRRLMGPSPMTCGIFQDYPFFDNCTVTHTHEALTSPNQLARVFGTASTSDDAKCISAPAQGEPPESNENEEPTEDGDAGNRSLRRGSRIAIISIALVAAVFIMWVMVLRRRRKQSSLQPENNSEERTTKPPGSSDKLDCETSFSHEFSIGP